jgi:uncharacterized protein (TIGR02391 family)
MPRRILDEALVSKLARKRRAKPLTIGPLVSKAARKHQISPQAALVMLAQRHGIGTATFQRRLDAATKAEIRQVFASSRLPAENAKSPPFSRRGPRVGPDDRAVWNAAIKTLIADEVLRARCGDVLCAKTNFDRAVNQATQVLEDRIRRKVGSGVRLTGEKLVGFAFNEDTSKSKLQIAGGNPDEQRGFTQLLRGVVPAFRNNTHHHVIDGFSKEDALRICGIIDLLLRVVDGATVSTFEGGTP